MVFVLVIGMPRHQGCQCDNRVASAVLLVNNYCTSVIAICTITSFTRVQSVVAIDVDMAF